MNKNANKVINLMPLTITGENLLVEEQTTINTKHNNELERAQYQSHRLIGLAYSMDDFVARKIAETDAELFNALILNDRYTIMSRGKSNPLEMEKYVSMIIDSLAHRKINNAGKFYKGALEINYLMKFACTYMTKIHRLKNTELYNKIMDGEWAKIYLNSDYMKSIKSLWYEPIEEIYKRIEEYGLHLEMGNESNFGQISGLLDDCYGAWASMLMRESYTDKSGTFNWKEFAKNFHCLFNESGELITLVNIREAYEICSLEWICIRKDGRYDRQGIATDLLRISIDAYKGENDIRCMCWRTEDDFRIHLHNAMETLGFRLISKADNGFNVQTGTCKLRKLCKYFTGDTCRCDMDLYELDIHSYRDDVTS